MLPPRGGLFVPQWEAGDVTVIANRAARSTIPGPEACCASARAPVLGGDVDETLAVLARALVQPARVRIVRLLAEQGTCITGDLVAKPALAQSTISEHVRVVREAGLVPPGGARHRHR